MAAGQPTAACNALGLESGKRILKPVDPIEVSAIGTGARRKLWASIKEQRGAAILHGPRERPDMGFLQAFTGVRKPQQHRGDLGGPQRLAKQIRKAGGIRRRNEIKTRNRAPR